MLGFMQCSAVQCVQSRVVKRYLLSTVGAVGGH